MCSHKLRSFFLLHHLKAFKQTLIPYYCVNCPTIICYSFDIFGNHVTHLLLLVIKDLPLIDECGSWLRCAVALILYIQDLSEAYVEVLGRFYSFAFFSRVSRYSAWLW